MGRLVSLVGSLLAASAVHAQAIQAQGVKAPEHEQTGHASKTAPLSISRNGWTVETNPEQGELRISHDGLGAVLEHVRLNLEGERGLIAAKSWSAEKHGEDELLLRSGEPRAVWVLRLKPNELWVSTTSADGWLSAKASAPPQRIVARLMDPRGIPVDWSGTAEVHGSYGGGVNRPAFSFSAPKWGGGLFFSGPGFRRRVFILFYF